MIRIIREGDELTLRFPRRSTWLNKVRRLPSRTFQRPTGLGNRDISVWTVPYTKENWDAMQALGFPLDGIERPTRTEYIVDVAKKNLILRTPYSPKNVQKCQGIPDDRTWVSKQKAWRVGPTRANVRYLLEAFPMAEWTDGAAKVRDKLMRFEEESAAALKFKESVLAVDIDVEGIVDYQFGTRPFKHQSKAFLLSRNAENYGLFMEQGTGKTKVVIDTACFLFKRGELDGVLIIAPNSVKSTWEEEIELHTPNTVDYECVVYRAGIVKMTRQGEVLPKTAELESVLRPTGATLPWLVMNVEAFSYDKGEKLAKEFIGSRRVMVVVDESSRIKTPGAKRTKSITRVGREATFRRILTGTPVTQSPLDIYAQFTFLDPAILGYSSYYAFRNHFATIEGPYNQVVAYNNMDELKALIEPFTFRVTRDECLDLPPKLYATRRVELSKEQQKLYDQMRDDMIAELSEHERVTATIVLTQLLRLQQIVGGFAPVERDEDDQVVTKAYQLPGDNPKVAALLDIAEDTQGKIVVWARFRAEIALIAASLRKAYGNDSVAELHGGIEQEDRTKARHDFQNPDSPVRFLVGNQATGGLGITLTEAKTVVYYSNTFSLEERLQSEDRVHRIGQSKNVEYIDLVARKTIDEKVVKALRKKKKYADLITGDDWKDWI